MKTYFSIFLYFPLAHLCARQAVLQWTEANRISDIVECNLFITKLFHMPYIFDEHTLILSEIHIFRNK